MFAVVALALVVLFPASDPVVASIGGPLGDELRFLRRQTNPPDARTDATKS
jgi:hypothetical protein